MMLKAVEPIYHLASAVKNFFYNQNIFKSVQLNASVISVGNLSFGGTGKTPCIEFLARELSSAFQVAIVCRSYKAQLQEPAEVDLSRSSPAAYFGDEACLLKKNLPQCRVWAGRQKFMTALLADQQKPDIILIDDGFSHRQIQRDFDLVLFDVTRTKDYYRENLKSLKRAHAVLLTKTNFATATQLQILKKKIIQWAPNIRSNIYEAQSETKINLPKTAPLFIFCGLAQPESFRKSVENLGFEILHFEKLTDHFQYSLATEQKILTMYLNLKKINPDLKLVTTEKDRVKLADGELLKQLHCSQHKMILNDSDKVGLLEKIRSNL